VKTQSSIKNRPFVWEDEAPAELRVRQNVSPRTSALYGTPQLVTGADEDDSPGGGEGRKGGDRFDRLRQERPSRPWWRPASAAGRTLLLLATFAVLGGLATSAYLLKTFLDRDGRFRVAGADNIEVSGLTEVSQAQMLSVFGEDIGRNIFFIPLSERRKQLEAIPWIERATVMRLLPDQIRVAIVERQPVAFVRQGQQIGLVDASGVLLSMPAAMMAQHHYSFPVVTGIDVRDSLASHKARMTVYQRLLAELDSNGQKLSEQISEIDLTDSADARVLMPEQGGDILAHFGEDRFLERYQRYQAHIAEWRKQYPKLTAVDLRYEQQAVLEMASGTNVAQVAVDEQAAATTDDGKPSNEQVARTSTEKQTSETKAATDHSQTVAKAKPVKLAGKVGSKGSRESKNAVAKNKTSQLRKSGNGASSKAAKAKAIKIKAQEKKRMDAKRAALNVNRQKIPPTSRPATSAGEGQ
jgi:cell division protein FtsQ